MPRIYSLILFSLLSCSVGVQSTDKYENYTKYVNKKVNDFIDDPNHADYKKHSYIHDPVTVFRGVSFMYDTMLVNLYIGDIKYVEPVSKLLEWDFEKVKKEKISRITIIGGYGLIYDSANQKE